MNFFENIAEGKMSSNIRHSFGSLPGSNVKRFHAGDSVNYFQLDWVSPKIRNE